MNALRPLALCFLVSASAFSLAQFLQTHPTFRRDAMARVQNFDETVWRPAMTALRNTSDALFAPPTSDARVVLELMPPTPMEERAVARVELAPIERPGIAQRDTSLPDSPILIEPMLPALPPPPAPVRVSRAPVPAAPLPAPVSPRVVPRVPEAPRLQAQGLSREQSRAHARLVANLTPDMRRNFDLFLFVSKATTGPLAQRMYVFRKDGDSLALMHDWAASTGREKQ
jgi:hypothetical protein